MVTSKILVRSILSVYSPFSVPERVGAVMEAVTLFLFQSTFRKMVITRSAVMHIESSKKAAEELKSLLKTNLWEEADLLEIIPAASVASLLLEIIECIEKISEALNELGKAASFRKINATVLPELPDSIQHETVQQHCHSATLCHSS
ncbi:hypothetical protein V6N13_000728 [Hibiscus sabdariffa]|uniref:Aluminum-activated malate transporter n=1 Tax=Hibiscus sabdariffa TaxID=183260 RepID=A0ABR2G677_9ROSI